MIVNYYAILECDCKIYQEKAVLFPPAGTGVLFLKRYQFSQRPNGGWYKILSEEETAVIMKNYPDNPVTFTDNMDKILAGISIASLILAILTISLFIFDYTALSILIAGGLNIISLITASAVRCRYPKSIFSSMLLMIQIAAQSLVVIFIIKNQYVFLSLVSALSLTV
ncbi:MAG: hypothetical protein IJ644_02670 [Oscillospiraceae bacterium]|nr:hypothetical protein [Oscillospiraceae bacterium]